MFRAFLNLFKAKCIHGIPVEDSYCDICENAKVERQARWEEQKEAKRKEAQRLAEARLEAQKDELVALHQLDHLLKINPYEFEELILKMFENLGWRTEKTPKSGDSGIDGIIFKDDQKILVQCKRLKKGKVGEPVIRDLYGNIVAKEATSGIIVTTSEFSQKAIEWSEGKQIELIGASKLMPIIQQAFRDESPIPEASIARNLLEKQTKEPCPECGKELVLRKGAYGDFIGCRGYPNCKYTKELEFSGKRKKKYKKPYR